MGHKDAAERHNEQLRLTGLTRVEDALAAIPAISLDQSSGQAIEATGIATLQLRNLGVKRTLVLMNGRRLPAGTPSGGVDSSAADINLIPGQLIERVEVLTGGASSTYGADAVAGVVNFIMQDDFQGLKFDTQATEVFLKLLRALQHVSPGAVSVPALVLFQHGQIVLGNVAVWRLTVNIGHTFPKPFGLAHGGDCAEFTELKPVH